MSRCIAIVFFVITFCTVTGFVDMNQANAISSAREKWLSDAESPFLREDYKYGNITMKSGRLMQNVKMRINLSTKETEFMFNGLTANLPKGSVKEIVFKDTTDNGIINYKLKTGYPPIYGQTPEHFYIVLSDGRCSFLKSIQKKIIESKNDMDQKVIREYETNEIYFFYSNGSMKQWKKDKDFLLGEMADKQEQVNKFIADNKTSFRNVESVVLLVNYYNSL